MHSLSFIYPLISLLAIAAAFFLSREMQSRIHLSRRESLIIGLAGFSGAMIGAKLPYAIFNEASFFSFHAWFNDGKTILTGLLGGYLGVEIGKKIAGVKVKTGDSYAVPVAVAIGIGRIGCFVGKCCYGTPTTLPWGVNFGDGVLRHPTQIYEAIFHFAMAFLLFRLLELGVWRRQLIKFYILVYLLYRFLTEFIRPEPEMFWGLTAYQWVALVCAPIFIGLWIRDNVGVDDTLVD